MLNLVIGGKQYYPLELTYDRSLERLGARIKASFPLADNLPRVPAEIGSTVWVYEDWKNYFVGTITEVKAGGDRLSITAYDSCYYLNHSKRIIQFSDMTVSEALAALFKECGLFNHHCPEMTAKVESICYMQSPTDIAKKLVQLEEDENGGEYYLTSDSFNSVEVYKVGELDTGIELSAVISPSRSQTLDGVKNRVTLVVSDGEGYTVTETASDGLSIAKYGLISEIEEISSDASGAVAIAQNRLQQKKQLLAEGSVTVKGSWELTAIGRRIKVTEPVTGLSGEYVITSVQHKLGDDFQTTLGLREYSEVISFKPTVEAAKTESLDTISESRKNEPVVSSNLILPFRSRCCRLTSRYGYRTHPVTGQKNSFHGGVDLVGITTGSGNGNIVTSVASGRVIRSRIVTDKSDTTWQWGNYVAVLGDDGATIYYCHLASRTVKEGQTVRRGDQIGIEGTTGQSTGVHLHFEVRRGNERINAAEYLGIPNEPGTYYGIAPTSGSSAGVINSIVERMNNV